MRLDQDGTADVMEVIEGGRPFRMEDEGRNHAQLDVDGLGDLRQQEDALVELVELFLRH
jgi:hypothetical protein